MALTNELPAIGKDTPLSMSVSGDNLVCVCNGHTYEYNLNEVRAALAGVAQQNATGTACGEHTLVVSSRCGNGDLTLCGNSVDDINAVCAHVHGVSYNFSLAGARSAIAVARAQAYIG